VTEEVNEQAQQAEANASEAPVAPPKFDPDPALVEESARSESRRDRVVYRRKDPKE
jgi:hypothetical protein